MATIVQLSFHNVHSVKQMNESQIRVVMGRQLCMFIQHGKRNSGQVWDLTAEEMVYSISPLQNPLPAESFAFRYPVLRCDWPN